MSDQKQPLQKLEALQKLVALAKFGLDPDEIPEESSGKTTIDGVDYYLEEPVEDGERSLCPDCAGSGQGRFGGTCIECHGWGVVPTESELEEAVALPRVPLRL